jgi:hypothetical protein
MTSDEELRNKIIKFAVDGRMKCAHALAIAKDFKIAPKRVGDMLNEMKIKIISCQLGCFK